MCGTEKWEGEGEESDEDNFIKVDNRLGDKEYDWEWEKWIFEWSDIDL